ncbi:MAG: hypothetical protein KAG64_06670 [Bacteroidales bacterium]|nr:hypothetical protein [Bacteroidales bacterium]
MKKIITLIMSLLMISVVYADGIKPLSLLPDGYKPLSPLSTTYAPDPNSGDVRNAFNFYAGLGSVHSSNYGMSIGADFEFQAIDPNLTIGPQFGLGVHSYYNGGYWHNNSYYGGNVHQLSFSGGVIVRYYADWLIPNIPDEFDVFIMSNAGFGLITYSNDNDYYDNDTYFDWGIYVGGRWNFKESMSLYAHLGSGSTNISVGLSLKM